MSDEKNIGLYKKFRVQKVGNPTKKIDCIVLEFDDPIAQKAINFWADEMHNAGYIKCAAQTKQKIIFETWEFLFRATFHFPTVSDPQTVGNLDISGFGEGKFFKTPKSLFFPILKLSSESRF